MKIKVIFIMVILVCLSFLHPYALAGRPLSTEDTGISGHGEVGLEMGFDLVVVPQEKKSYFSLLFTPAIGIGRFAEFSADVPLLIKDKGALRLSDVIFYLKVSLFRNGKIASAVRFQMKLPTGDWREGEGSGDEDFGFVFVLGGNWKRVAVYMNAGFVFAGNARDPSLRNYLIYAFSGEVSLSSAFTFVAELYGESNSHFDVTNFKHHMLNPLVGCVYELKNGIALDVGFRLGLESLRVVEVALSFGLTI